MRDPDRGINSPAFKKFMADRGMYGINKSHILRLQ